MQNAMRKDNMLRNKLIKTERKRINILDKHTTSVLTEGTVVRSDKYYLVRTIKAVVFG